MLKRSCLALAFLTAAQGFATAAIAQPSETAVKAAFLPRFARYVTWPPAVTPRVGEAFILCVVGDDRFGQLLDEAARAQSIDGRPVTVRRVHDGTNAGGCHVAFVQGTRQQPVGQLLAAMGRRPILTVTDASSGGQRGMIHFSLQNGRVRFFIDQGAAQQRGMSISSRLLALAVGVKQ
jgi:YfiR/HmsC-like